MNMSLVHERIHQQFSTFIERKKNFESSEMIAQRCALFEKYLEIGFPTRKNEDWKYTRAEHFLHEDMQLFVSNGTIVLPKKVVEEINRDFPKDRVVFFNGYYSEEYSSFAKDTFEISKSSVLIHPEDSTDAFELLSEAFLEEKIIIRVMATNHPVHLSILHFSASIGIPLFLNTRMHVDFDPGVKCTIAEHFKDVENAPIIHNVINSFDLEKNAQLEHCSIQNHLAATTSLLSHTSVKQKKDSRYASVLFSEGAGKVKNTYEVTLNEENASVSLYGAYMMKEKGLVDNTTVIHHSASHTHSSEVYKGLIDGHAQGVFHGSIIVPKHMKAIDSSLTNKTILLTEDAKMNTKPELRIYADDVICSHGAAIGALDEDAIYYLRARGIGEQKAKYMMSLAFIQEILEHVTDHTIRQKLIDTLKSQSLLD